MVVRSHSEVGSKNLGPEGRSRRRTSSDAGRRWTAAAVLVSGSVAANAAFIGLGSSFEYPDILAEPTQDILRLFDDTRATTMTWVRGTT